MLESHPIRFSPSQRLSALSKSGVREVNPGTFYFILDFLNVFDFVIIIDQKNFKIEKIRMLCLAGIVLTSIEPTDVYENRTRKRGFLITFRTYSL